MRFAFERGPPAGRSLARVLRDKTRQRVQRIKFHWQTKEVSFPPYYGRGQDRNLKLKLSDHFLFFFYL